MASSESSDAHHHDADADDHVQGVHAGHDEVEGEEDQV